MNFDVNVVLYLSAYLLGSIPFGLVLGKIFANVDVRKSGSNNIGATNVLRVLKKTNPKKAKIISASVLALDILKAVLIIGIAIFLDLDRSVLWSLGVLVVLGHCYSAYLFFEGGKGVATALGVFAILMPYATLVALATWAICALVLKISSLSSLIGLCVLVLYALIFENGLGIDSNAPMIIIAFVVIYKHIPNIMRLIDKKEQAI
jgi:glycerol-3-phosphate acyltransferase PlsY